MSQYTRKVVLRNIRPEDSAIISQAFAQQGWNKPVAQYESYLRYQAEGSRDIILAELAGDFAGYLSIVWQSGYIPFREKNIPEIVDFNVLKKYQRQGIGTALMDEAEKRIKKVSQYAGIGFGVTPDYGAAQVLYIKRNYIPDGRGLVRGSKPLTYGETVMIDDNLVFCLIKEL